MDQPREIAGYRVLSRLGEGAASTLYAVHDPHTKHVWALKHVIKESEKDQRFLDQTENEYAVGSKLDHPNLRKVEKIIRHRKRFRVVGTSLLMELVDASTLDQLPPMTDLSVVRVFRQVAKALLHMHQRGFVHTDLKPNNIMLTEKGQVKVIDLGQACRVGTVKKRIQGTPGYMAPEQAHRQAITPRTDVYNFGATMYWVLCRDVIPTALPPKDDNSLFTGALDASLVEAPIPPHERDPRIHPLLSQQVLDCVKLNPEQRPDMQVVLDRLQLIGEVLENPERAAEV
ncbi:MAG: serine/threonine-protein kinase [Planctomycetota bacterium]|jgi:serine/threonine-protein kinase